MTIDQDAKKFGLSIVGTFIVSGVMASIGTFMFIKSSLAEIVQIDIRQDESLRRHEKSIIELDKKHDQSERSTMEILRSIERKLANIEGRLGK